MAIQKVVVTGASGFIGQAVVKTLVKDQSFDVVAVSRSKCSYVDCYQIENYRDTPGGDVLIHLAEQPDCGQVNSLGDAYLEESTSVLTTLLKKNYKKVIYASSSVIYGDVGQEPFPESSFLAINNVYSKNKHANENLVLSRPNGIIVRLANVIGLGMAANNVVSDILAQIPGVGSITVRNGVPVRDFICVSDVVDAILQLLKSSKSGVYNVGLGSGVSIAQLASLCLKAVGESHRQIESKADTFQASYNVMNVQKIKNDIGWTANVTLEDCIKQIILNRNMKVDEML